VKDRVGENAEENCKLAKMAKTESNRTIAGLVIATTIATVVLC